MVMLTELAWAGKEKRMEEFSTLALSATSVARSRYCFTLSIRSLPACASSGVTKKPARVA
jgi:hypothetical protein